jgi:hypothetical protein
MITGARYVQPRRRPALTTGSALSAHGLPLKSDMVIAGPIGKIQAANLRAAANIAAWRTYLPEDCVAAMIDGGWHWST